MTYEELLISLCSQDESLFVMTAENRASIRNFPQKMPDRFVDVGIAEMTLCGMAAGLGLRGRKPVVHALAAFLTSRAYEFIKTDISYPNIPVKLVGYIPGLLSTANGPTHQAIDDIGLMYNLPNMNVFAPSDVEDMLIGLPKVLESPLPFYIRYTDQPPIIKHSENFEIGKAEQIGNGKNVSILTYGILLKEAIAAKQKLEEIGINTRVINLRSIKPIDYEAIIQAAIDTQILITLEDHLIYNGLFSIVSQVLAFNNIKVKLLPFGLKNYFKPALDINEILEYEGLTGKIIYKKIYHKLRSN